MIFKVIDRAQNMALVYMFVNLLMLEWIQYLPNVFSTYLCFAIYLKMNAKIYIILCYYLLVVDEFVCYNIINYVSIDKNLVIFLNEIGNDILYLNYSFIYGHKL